MTPDANSAVGVQEMHLVSPLQALMVRQHFLLYISTYPYHMMTLLLLALSEFIVTNNLFTLEN
jgi:hypothetical protein